MSSGTGEAVANLYNGWPNYETWTVSLWLDNDEASYRHWRAVAREMRVLASQSRYVRDNNMGHDEAAACELADRLRTAAEDGCPDIGPTMYADLLRGALGEVDWRSIAENLLEDID